MTEKKMDDREAFAASEVSSRRRPLGDSLADDGTAPGLTDTGVAPRFPERHILEKRTLGEWSELWSERVASSTNVRDVDQSLDLFRSEAETRRTNLGQEPSEPAPAAGRTLRTEPIKDVVLSTTWSGHGRTTDEERVWREVVAQWLKRFAAPGAWLRARRPTREVVSRIMQSSVNYLGQASRPQLIVGLWALLALASLYWGVTRNPTESGITQAKPVAHANGQSGGTEATRINTLAAELLASTAIAAAGISDNEIPKRPSVKATLGGRQTADRPRPESLPPTLAPFGGQLTIQSTPRGARVTVNGIGRGDTPLTLTRFPLGSHVIRVTKPGFRAEQRTVSLTSGKPRTTATIVLRRSTS